MIRNRIKEHRKVKASELIPHPQNIRKHPEAQKELLQNLYSEIGFARSVLAYETKEGLVLIDGHLRKDIDPDMIVDVEILDVNDQEAKVLLASIDPIAMLADWNADYLSDVMDEIEDKSAAATGIWKLIEKRNSVQKEKTERQTKKAKQNLDEGYHVMIECSSEEEQKKLLREFKQRGISCKALIT